MPKNGVEGRFSEPIFFLILLVNFKSSGLNEISCFLRKWHQGKDFEKISKAGHLPINFTKNGVNWSKLFENISLFKFDRFVRNDLG